MKTPKFIKPKYKIGDIVIYRDRYDEDVIRYIQSIIIRADSRFYKSLPNDDEDVSEWYYVTQEIENEKLDDLEEKEIICKLN